ncbi:hypothetical protein MTR67_045003 [Solanum verrucosum]|uniref:non-specific serine/threonine protein kinase n=1 Tax=Solanum verrucosum TaxID=315347 RepID=A0AAF0ZVS6_SOLVR|nr:hypothetical protein MTR67_045003 [Solanum verrucosum]
MNVTYEADASPANGVIQLTKNQLDSGESFSVGRATYSKELYLWDKASGKVTDFSTHFSFEINSQGRNYYADGLAFFLAPAGSVIPEKYSAAGEGLGLAIDNGLNTSRNQPFVAVEFDTFKNAYDPPGDHVGVDINSMVSLVNVAWLSRIPYGTKTDAWITYNSTSRNLSVVFTGFRQQGNTTVTVLQNLSYNLDLREYLPEWKFLYGELARCTNNFSPEEMLGHGGFGGVYKGYLREYDSYIAVKRISRESKQGIEEYASEVRIISRLRHKHLVQLIGWCHQKRELLLVYEFMPNGSLDHHLFKGKSHLTWPIRFKIAQGLASALFYLHEEWEQSRLVDHDKGSQTTVLAGTMGYMAPECLTTGKASKETDVYSFGVVALEIVCGRKPIDPKSEEHQVNIIEWAWRLYGMGNLSEAVDPRLSSELNEQEVEHLLIVGLWCAHPDNNCRPSIRQAIQVLNFEAPLPTLPPNMPVPIYCSYESITSLASPYDSNGPQISEINSSVTRDYTGSSNNTAGSSPSASLLYTR